MSNDTAALSPADDWPGDAWRAHRRFRSAKECARHGMRTNALASLRLAISYRDRAIATGSFHHSSPTETTP